MLIAIPRGIFPMRFLNLITHWRVRRVIGDVCVPSHPFYRVLYRPATPREQIAAEDGL